MSKPSHNLLIFSGFLLLVSLTCGFVLGFYQKEVGQGPPHPVYSMAEVARAQKLNRKLDLLEHTNTELESEIRMLNYRIDDQIRQIYQRSQRKKMEQLAEFAGTHLRKGKGLEIILKDSPKPVRPEENPNAGIVHNVDLLMITNQLRAAGARAIAINNQRISANTEIDCAGPIILINKSRITSPFVIQAVGDPKLLLEKMNGDNSYLKHLAAYGIEITLEARKVEIPAYTQPLPEA